MVDVSQLVRVTTRIATGGVPRLAFNRGLLITLDDGLSPAGTGKTRLFNSLAEVESALGSGDAHDGAAIWFGADPAAQGLWIGRWQPTDIDTALSGTPPAGQTFNAGALAASNGSFTLNGVDVTGIDLSAATTGAAIATALEAAINGTSLSGWTVAYDTATGFTVGHDTPGPITGGGLGDTAATTDTDIAAALGLDPDNATYHLGTDAETITEAATAMVSQATGGEPVYVMLAADAPLTYGTAADDTRDDLSAWAQANEVVFGLRDTSDDAYDATSTTDKIAEANAAQRQYVAGLYSDDDNYPDIGLCARMSSQDFNRPNSIISPQGDSLPNVEPVSLDSAQLAALADKRGNVYTSVNGTPALLGGYTARDGYWLDAVVFLLWLKSEMESAIWRSLRASRRYNRALLYDALAGVLQTALASGGLQRGGTVGAATKADIIATTGNRDFNGVLARGYLIWVNPSPSAADAENRIGSFKVWVKGSEAIHTVDGDVTFTN